MLGSFRLTFLGILTTALTVFAADGPIRLPVAPPVPQPMPAPPEPGGVLRLAAGEWYAVESDVELVPLCHPRGLVKFSKKKPGTFLGKFAGGNGQVEERDLKGPFVYLGTASGVGRAELFFVPLGLKAEADIAFAVIDVDAGEGPCPPPKPKPEPKPVDPSAPIAAPGLRVLIVYETGDVVRMTPAQNGIIYGAKAREYMNANCVVGDDGKTREFRIWDKDVDASGESKLWQAAFKRPRSSIPWLLVSNGVSGFEGPLPANTDEFLTLVEKYKGVK